MATVVGNAKTHNLNEPSGTFIFNRPHFKNQQALNFKISSSIHNRH